MNIQNIHLVYFSATYTTQKVVREVAQSLGGTIIEQDLTNTQLTEDIHLEKGKDLLVVGVPVYAGRVPALILDSLNRFKGNQTPAIAVCVYGNREYDDALLELKNIVEGNGFVTVAAGAFIAQHSIFPQVAALRPDESDMNKIKAFGQACADLLQQIKDTDALPKLQVKGNYPYKEPGSVPLHPSGDEQCTQCGTCIELCPTHAISEENPQETNTNKCISCGRCIVVCPQQARNFRSPIYPMASANFIQNNIQRKEPETYLLTVSL